MATSAVNRASEAIVFGTRDVRVADPVTVVLGFDDRFARYAAVTIASVLSHATTHTRIVCLTSQLGPRSLELLKGIAKRFDREVTVVMSEHREFDDAPLFKQVTAATYYRLTIPDVVVGDRAIYLDSDVVATTCLRELFDTDLSNAAMGGCAILMNPKSRITLPPGDPYLSAGVLLMDLVRLRQMEFTRLAHDWLASYGALVRFADQCVINSVLIGMKKGLPERWNLAQTTLGPAFREKAMDGAGIVHFNGSAKPWMEWSDHWEKALWRRYLPVAGLSPRDVVIRPGTVEQWRRHARSLAADGHVTRAAVARVRARLTAVRGGVRRRVGGAVTNVLSRRTDVSSRRWLLLPIETKGREKDGKGLLAFEAAERGWGVILGGKAIRRMADLPRGLLIEKSIDAGQAEFILASHTMGRKVSAWCEEGLIYNSAEEYGRRKVERRAYDLLESYFAWGQKQADDMVGTLGCDGRKIVITGNPRFDLHRPELRAIFSRKVERIRKAHAPFILINTKFSKFSNYIGPEAMIARIYGSSVTKEQEADARGVMAYQGANFEKFGPMVVELSRRYPDRRIVIRPHPSESHDPWHAIASGLPNVSVVYEGNVAEWLLAADLSIHNNCTTGVEAYLLGRTTIAYSPVRDDRYDLYLPNALSHQAFDLDQLLGMVASTIGGEEISGSGDAANKADIATHYIANAGGTPACQTIMDALELVDLPKVPLSRSASLLGDVEGAVRRRLRPLKQMRLKGEQAAERRYINQKFGGVGRSEVLELLQDAQHVTGRFKDVRIAELEENTFCIYRAG